MLNIAAANICSFAFASSIHPNHLLLFGYKMYFYHSHLWWKYAKHINRTIRYRIASWNFQFFAISLARVSSLSPITFVITYIAIHKSILYGWTNKFYVVFRIMFFLLRLHSLVFWLLNVFFVDLIFYYLLFYWFSYIAPLPPSQDAHIVHDSTADYNSRNMTPITRKNFIAVVARVCMRWK